MSSRRTFLLSAAGAAFARPTLAKTWAASSQHPPVARVAPVSDIYWGQTVLDPYRWMETKPATAEWADWLKGQAVYARHALDALPAQKPLHAALKAYTAETTDIYVVQVGATFLVTRSRAPGQQGYSLNLSALDAAGKVAGPAKLLINPVKLGKDGQPARITFCEVSPDGRFLAYGLDAGGNEIEALHILTVATGEDVLVTSINSRQCSWLPDSSGYFYQRLRADAVYGSIDYSFGASVYLHIIGTDPSNDREVFTSGEGPGADDLSKVSMPVLKTFAGSDHVLALHLINGNTPGAIYVAKFSELSLGKTPWRVVCSRDDLPGDTRPEDWPVAADIVGDDIYVLTRGKASRGEIIKVPVADPAVANRVTVVPQTPYVMDLMFAAKDGLYIHELRGLIGALKRYSYVTGKIEDVALPAEGAVWGVVSSQLRDGCWFGMDGLAWPVITVVTTGDLKAVNSGVTPRPPYDVSRYETTRIDVTARDGAAVPMEMIYAKSTRPNGKNPTLIDAYGAYGAMLDPGFQSPILAFLDQGGIVVYAHVRGGGERGEAWHLAGQKATKPNTWRDAIDVAEYLVKAGWTAPAHLAIWGTSAGGIMVGRAITERPDLFAAAIAEVGIFNTLRFELTANGPGNDVEFGTVKKEGEFSALYEMDSYHHVRDGVKYPAVLCITGANDLRVEPWVVGKFAARLQAATASHKPVLLRVDYASGHFAADKQLANAKYADIFSFVLRYT